MKKKENPFQFNYGIGLSSWAKPTTSQQSPTSVFKGKRKIESDSVFRFGILDTEKISRYNLSHGSLSGKVAIFYKGKVITIGDTMIDMIRKATK